MVNPSTHKQLTDTVVMVTPDQFRYEAATAHTNKFEKTPEELGIDAADVPLKAMREFRAMVKQLELHDISVRVLRSPWETDTPAAVFPNNWFSHHAEGQLALYPMLTAVRRSERQYDALRKVLFDAGIVDSLDVDLTHFEHETYLEKEDEEPVPFALEGTGSLVLDRVQRVAFAVESKRTTKRIFDEWCRRLGYEGFFFHAFGDKDYPIYHTNVVMTIGAEFAVVCFDSIPDAYAPERTLLEQKLMALGKHIIKISKSQLNSYCANILQLKTRTGDSVIVLSQTAFEGFDLGQLRRLRQYGELLLVAIPIIEGIGGGSARCMLAEVFRA